MKPFNLELVKQGHPVCTRDGRDARIICFDLDNPYKIAAAIENEQGCNYLEAYTDQGERFVGSTGNLDLFMKTPTLHIEPSKARALKELGFNWVALDKDGEVWAFLGEPQETGTCWIGDCDCVRINHLLNHIKTNGVDWKDSLINLDELI